MYVNIPFAQTTLLRFLYIKYPESESQVGRYARNKPMYSEVLNML